MYRPLREHLLDCLVGQGMDLVDARKAIEDYAKAKFSWAAPEEFDLDGMCTDIGAEFYINSIMEWLTGDRGN